MNALAMTSGEAWTLVLIIVIALVFGVLVVTNDTDWFD